MVTLESESAVRNVQRSPFSCIGKESFSHICCLLCLRPPCRLGTPWLMAPDSVCTTNSFPFECSATTVNTSPFLYPHLSGKEASLKAQMRTNCAKSLCKSLCKSCLLLLLQQNMDPSSSYGPPHVGCLQLLRWPPMV